MTIKERIRFWFDDLSTPMGRAVDLVIMLLIAVACVNAVAMTYWPPENHPGLWYLDMFITVCFVIEYLLRLWVAEDRLRHVFKLYSLIDLLAILPAGGLRGLRIFRLLRILRLIRFLETEEFFFGRIKQIHLYVIRIAFTLTARPSGNDGSVPPPRRRGENGDTLPGRRLLPARRRVSQGRGRLSAPVPPGARR